VGTHSGGAGGVSEDAPQVGCGAAIVREGTILLVLRRKAPEAACWSLPGGKVEFLERIEDAVRREVFEEVGVEIELDRLLHITQTIGVDGQHWVSPVFQAHIVAGEPENREPAKHAGVAWFSCDTPPARLAQAAREAISKVFAQSPGG
jgi:8-oxo-dGTP diphosphatase